ncbi:MAG TPA: hypothetical protein VNN79_06180 [Actinomycetota bacterium]|nr:hypothetical protein [Actinomycetota bacterium]
MTEHFEIGEHGIVEWSVEDATLRWRFTGHEAGPHVITAAGSALWVDGVRIQGAYEA